MRGLGQQEPGRGVEVEDVDGQEEDPLRDPEGVGPQAADDQCGHQGDERGGGHPTGRPEEGHQTCGASGASSRTMLPMHE